MNVEFQQDEQGNVFMILPSKVLNKLEWSKDTKIKFEIGYDMKNSPSVLIVRKK